MTNPAVIQNPAREKPLAFAELGRRVNRDASTIYRWSTKGSMGVVLESMYLGGKRCTSEEAWIRYCRRLQEAAQAPRGADVRPEPPQPLSRESLNKAIAAGLAPKSIARRPARVQHA